VAALVRSNVRSPFASSASKQRAAEIQSSSQSEGGLLYILTSKTEGEIQ